jgi:hypothetical protein
VKNINIDKRRFLRTGKTKTTLVVLKERFSDFANKYFNQQLFIYLVSMMLPVFFMAILLGIYNYIRFGNLLEFGYSNQDLVIESLRTARNYGLFSIIHIPGNVYYSLLAMPLPVFRYNMSHVLKFPFIARDAWGMSIFITSPYFFYLFFLKHKDILSKILIFVILVSVVPIYMYYGIGYVQFGYRYLLDLMPFIFLLLMKNYYLKFNNVSFGLKFLILFSAFFNVYLFFSPLYVK